MASSPAVVSELADCATWQCREVHEFTGTSLADDDAAAVMRINPSTRTPSLSRADLAGHVA